MQVLSVTVSFSPANIGIDTTVTATVVNNQELSFSNARLKFNMPFNSVPYQVVGGELTQIIEKEDYQIIYVDVDLPASSVITVIVGPGGLLTMDDLTIQVNGSDIVLNWGSVGGADEYRIFYGNTPYFEPGGLPAATVYPPATSWIDPGALDYGPRFYRLVVAD